MLLHTYVIHKTLFSIRTNLIRNFQTPHKYVLYYLLHIYALIIFLYIIMFLFALFNLY